MALLVFHAYHKSHSRYAEAIGNKLPEAWSFPKTNAYGSLQKRS